MAGASRRALEAASGVRSCNLLRARNLRGWGLFAGSALAASALFSCSAMLSDPAPQVETAALHEANGDAVIATLHTKDSEVRVLSSGGRVRYSVLDVDGASKSLTLEELQTYDRNLYEFVKAATARSGPPLDARIIPPPEPPSDSRERVEAGRHTPKIPRQD